MPGEYGPQVLGYWKSAGPLSHVLVRNAGHMMPHDAPRTGQLMLQAWVDGAEDAADAGGGQARADAVGGTRAAHA